VLSVAHAHHRMGLPLEGELNTPRNNNSGKDDDNYSGQDGASLGGRARLLHFRSLAGVA
jgi:hypothetical protein